jgi:hypothetical protein
MTFSTRTILTLTLTLALPGGISAQEATTTAPATTTATTSAATANTETIAPAPAPSESIDNAERRGQVRERFTRVMRQHPAAVGEVVAVDPTLLSNEPFVARYPELGQFLAQHPEIRRNPHYYARDLERPREPMQPRSALDDLMEAASIMFTVGLIAYALAWVVRTIIEQKRWNQLARRQSEVHNKILDRFSSSDELLTYVKSPAGSKFLESAPIALHSEPRKPATPVTRLLWSIQLGVIAVAVGLGMLLVSLRFSGESAHAFFAMGVIAFCVGGGFLASAYVSLLVSRRFGSWQESGSAANIADDAGMMR